MYSTIALLALCCPSLGHRIRDFADEFAEACPDDNGNCCLDCEQNMHCRSNGGCYGDGQPGCEVELCPAPPGAIPVTAAPVTVAPVTSAPVTSAPVTLAPVTAEPVTAPLAHWQTLDVLPPGAGAVLDWHFMTRHFSWAGREQNQFDVVQGHACQAGDPYYDNSYYATSLCYWHPETEHVAAQTWGLGWRGGSGGEEWCGDVGLQSGVCARCSVCHDNARDRDGSVDKAAARLEIIPLPDCMKEGAIEAECLQDFEANNGELVHEDARCLDVQWRYDEAVASLNSITSTIHRSEARINELPFEIHEARRQVIRLRRQVQFYRLQDSLAVGRGQFPNHALTLLTELQLREWEDTYHRKSDELPRLRVTLARSYENLPGATQRKEALEREWFPQEQACMQVIATATRARNAHMTVCAQHYYNQSCEKACVEIQRNGEHGCGVIEGSQDGDAFARGGVEVTCAPPAPSWIMSPSNYGGSSNPDNAEQCGRINAEQSVRATTPVMMSGYLQKACSRFCFGGDRRRFFVLESGNGVRSANLRYFAYDPAEEGTEHTNKGIIMWDAEEVSVAETSDVQACFEMKHYYRGRVQSWLSSGTTYTLCITREEYPEDNLQDLRDQWVSTLQQLLVWQPDAVGPDGY